MFIYITQHIDISTPCSPLFLYLQGIPGRAFVRPPSGLVFCSSSKLSDVIDIHKMLINLLFFFSSHNVSIPQNLVRKFISDRKTKKIGSQPRYFCRLKNTHVFNLKPQAWHLIWQAVIGKPVFCFVRIVLMSGFCFNLLQILHKILTVIVSATLLMYELSPFLPLLFISLSEFVIN